MNINELILLSEQGDMQATAELACEYLNGEKIEKDLKKGASLMLRAARAGHALAALNVSQMYKKGEGVPQSYQKSEEWALCAAELGEPEELGRIALGYIAGSRLADNPYETDYDKAFRYLNICSDAGDADSRANLGTCYEEGWGTEINIEKAIECYRTSVEAGSRVGFECCTRIAELGVQKPTKPFVDAQFYLGSCYLQGKGVAKDKALAERWLSEAAKNNHSLAQFTLATEIYLNSQDDKAAYWLERLLSDSEYENMALEILGELYMISTKEFDKAFPVLRKEVDRNIGGSKSIYMLGMCYARGLGVTPDLQQAISLLKKASDAGHKGAQDELASLTSTKDRSKLKIGGFYFEKKHISMFALMLMLFLTLVGGRYTFFLSLALIALSIFFFFSERPNSSDTSNSRSSTAFSKQQAVNRTASDEEIISDKNFQRELSYFRQYYQWMTLAGGVDPILTPIIKFDNGNITLEKKGYDLWLKNLNTYRNSAAWKEREAALELFAEDLFGKYSEEMKKIISIEYIADMIEIDNSARWESDFKLTITMPTSIKDFRARNLFRYEIGKTGVLKF